MQLDETFGRQSNGRPLTLMCKCSWLLEEQSTSTVENALHSLDIMKQKGLRRCDQLQGVPQEDISTQLGPHIALLEACIRIRTPTVSSQKAMLTIIVFWKLDGPRSFPSPHIT
eukprot:1147203-Pelagomonas_calceolata.AAC.2